MFVGLSKPLKIFQPLTEKSGESTGCLEGHARLLEQPQESSNRKTPARDDDGTVASPRRQFRILHCEIFVMQQHVDRGGYFRISQIVHRTPDA
jgi:hypothetical protein